MNAVRWMDPSRKLDVGRLVTWRAGFAQLCQQWCPQIGDLSRSHDAQLGIGRGYEGGGRSGSEQ